MTNVEVFSKDISIEPVGIVRNDLPEPPLIAKEDGLHLNEACGSAVKKWANGQAISRKLSLPTILQNSLKVLMRIPIL